MRFLNVESHRENRVPSEMAQHPTAVIPVEKPWKQKCFGEWTIMWAGCQGIVDRLYEEVANTTEFPCADKFTAVLSRMNTPFAAILTGPSGTVAVVDQNRSFPIFFTVSTGRPVLGGDARAVAVGGGKQAVHLEAALEAALSGYVTGQDTLLEGLHQLVAGTFLTWPNGERTPTIHRYFRYMPLTPVANNEADLIDALALATDQVVSRMVDAAAGRPIWGPSQRRTRLSAHCRQIA